MMCYKDMTFCSASCATADCHRQITPQVLDGARGWWSHDPDHAPIAMSDFSANCPDYKEAAE